MLSTHPFFRSHAMPYLARMVQMRMKQKPTTPPSPLRAMLRDSARFAQMARCALVFDHMQGRRNKHHALRRISSLGRDGSIRSVMALLSALKSTGLVT